MSYLQLFLQSYFIELAFLGLFFWGTSRVRLLCVSLFANAFTHPLLIFGLLYISGARLLPLLLWGEFAVVLVEALIYFHFLRKSFGMALLGSAAANFLSWELGPRLSYWMASHHFYF